MPVTVRVKPRLLRWARERAALQSEELARRVGLRPKRVVEWEQSGELSLVHLERVAEKTHTPIGYLFLEEPPTLALPIADFRGRTANEPSPELLDTIFQCELRQAWYKHHVVQSSEPPLAFVGSASDRDSVESVAQRIREVLGLDSAHRASMATWADALGDLYDRVEAAGILVMRNGVVGNNTHRPLEVSEFRGFALSDNHAPLIFVNAADSKAAQMFTVAHELAHIWRGESGVSDLALRAQSATERFCNRIAAEVLVPATEFARQWRRSAEVALETVRVARVFKVSSLVILLRALESQLISRESFEAAWASESERHSAPRTASGGDFYNTQRSRLGRRFATAVIVSALEGGTPYSEAFGLLGVKKDETFRELGRNLGVIA